MTFFIILITFNNNFYDGIFNLNLTFVNILNNTNESNTFNLTTQFILLDQEKIISTSTSPTNTITGYIPLVFYLISAIFSCLFYTKGKFAITKRLLPFLLFFVLCFTSNPQQKIKYNDLKHYRNTEFFSTEILKTASDINSAELQIKFCYLALNKLNFRDKKNLKFYQFLILLSGDISLNPGPNQYIYNEDEKFEPFRKRGLHFLHINVNSLLSKIDELRDIASRTKPAILGITESKLDNTVTDQEVNICGYSILRKDRNRNGGGVACYIRSDLCFNRKNTISNSIEHIFFDLLIPKLKPISIGIFYRPPNVNNFLETLSTDLGKKFIF